MKAPHFNLLAGQAILLDGKLLRLVRRGADEHRRLVFEGGDGVPVSMTDETLLRLQQRERRLRLLTETEAAGRMAEHEGRRPRALLTPGDTGEVGQRTRERLAYVRAWEQAGRPSRTTAGIADVIARTFMQLQHAGDGPARPAPPSARQVLRWISDWTALGGDVQCLVPQYARRGNGDDRLTPKARSILETVVHDRYLLPTRPTGVSVHMHVMNAFERHNAALPEAERLPVPCLNTTYRTIQSCDRFERDFARLGPRTARHNWRPVLSGPAAAKHNEVWEIDHATVDAIVVDETTGLPIGRPTVTMGIDRRTRMIVGFHIGFDGPGTYAVMEFLRNAVQPKDDLLAQAPGIKGSWPCMGTPEVLVTDQGREFKAATFVDACRLLGIDVQYTPVLKPWFKGKIERFFRHLAVSVFRRVPGTTFSSIAERSKEFLAEKVAMVTLRELRIHVLQFIVEIHNVRRHTALGTSPLLCWSESVRREGLRPLPDPAGLAVALAHVDYRKPQRYGITYEGLLYNSQDVGALRVRPDAPARVRIAVDPLDLTFIRVLDPANNRFVDVPIVPGLRALVEGVSLEMHRLARALQRWNFEKLGGADGLARAYAVIDDAMRAAGMEGGLAVRQRAQKHWDKLKAASRAEDAPAFDTAASALGILDDFDEQVPPDAREHEPPDADPPRAQAPPGDGRPAPEAAGRRARPRRVRDLPAGEAPELPATDHPTDLDEAARRLGMVPSIRTEDEDHE